MLRRTSWRCSSLKCSVLREMGVSSWGLSQAGSQGVGIAEVTTGVQPWGLPARGKAHRGHSAQPRLHTGASSPSLMCSLWSPHRSLTSETRWCTRPSTPSSTAWAASPTLPRTCGSGPSASPTHVSVFLSGREPWPSPSLGTLSGGALERVKITESFWDYSDSKVPRE